MQLLRVKVLSAEQVKHNDDSRAHSSFSDRSLGMLMDLRDDRSLICAVCESRESGPGGSAKASPDWAARTMPACGLL